ncbi:unnamed protein product [Ilex paraguariensis]|uniref:TIR domain-containing protein n=1 Tax=Ilex paraguariensis TaxID=185542 RepID=A0ABC8S978_9AQUA
MAGKSTQDKPYSSSSLSSTPPWKYDIFLSFRGEDTRKNFTDHLYTALVQTGIHIFRDDDELERGKEISLELLKAIRGSRISIIVFSKNYASSRWCLDELVEILECRKTIGQLVLPIFYDVDPSDVRKQTGSFAKAFARHAECFVAEIEKVERWRDALTEAGNLSGWDLQNVANGHEAKFIQKIVEDVLCQVKHTYLNVAKHPVGMDSRVNDIMLLLNIASIGVHVIGIYGMGGVGKTTLAKAVYNRIFQQFESASFLADVREVSGQQNGLVHLQEQLLSEILKKKNLTVGNIHRGIRLMKERLCSKRIIIVLDDVDHISQLNSLAGNHDWFGSRTRIIITTRDEHLLNQINVDDKYEAKELIYYEALQLFSWHAFGQPTPLENYLQLSNGVLKYAGGLPLALEVLGSYLSRRTIPEWISACEKLKHVPHNEILQKLRISFDALDDEVKDIFLDIGCFLVGMDKECTINILDGCGFFSEIGISVLTSRCLLKINEENQLRMHDLLRDMGREIIRKESPKEPEKRSRLWFHKDVCDVLKNQKVIKINHLLFDKDTF